MSFDWQSFQRLANELISMQRIPEIQEAYFRSAISRSYYAAFCRARDTLQAKGVTLPPGKVHEFVREQYESSPDRALNAIGANLHRLFSKRIHADYKDSPAIDLRVATMCSSLTTNLLRQLDRI
jgi:hypothetical protein